MMAKQFRTRPTLIVIGGFAGTGKTTLARRLSRDFAIPRLSSDVIGQTISASKGTNGGDVDAFWIAYDVVFRMCEDFLADGLSVILDLNMGWTFQWERVDAIVARYPSITYIPIVLRCSLDVSLDRIRQRYADDPTSSDPPETYTTTPHILDVWRFLDRLDRPDVTVIDAARSEDEVYDAIRQRIAQQA
jgi:predicted kinase